MKRSLAHPKELTDPCCLPALGELGEISPHGGLPRSLGERAALPQVGLISSATRATGSLSGGGFA